MFSKTFTVEILWDTEKMLETSIFSVSAMFPCSSGSIKQGVVWQSVHPLQNNPYVLTKPVDENF